MVKEATEGRGGRLETGGLTRVLRFDDPDEHTETIQPLAPGMHARAIGHSGFQTRILAWSLAGEPFFTYTSRNGSAVFDEGRPYCAVTIPLFSSFGVRVGSRRFDVQDGAMQVLPPDVRGELQPEDGAHMLGFSLDWARIEKHRRAMAGVCEGPLAPVPCTPVSAQFDRGWHFLAYMDGLCQGVNQADSLLHDSRVAREVVETIGCLLAEVLYACPASRRGQPDEAMARRAEELLAENLESPVSLSDAVIVAGTSTRSLLRAFLKRRGTSPMAFRRRRRFEAARRDLFVADCGETSVTDVAIRYCFEHLGRFAVEYRALFGESPSDTLRR